ncbi:hypothetical protein [Iodobacter fluviatilis]|uniref:Auto-transporter adhesin head GIN domain-containing protein n=1 Tax=Iodobacter fluviatilis TaxID=537 RepID=A0A7G3GD28_9NEIS|nr:hypothetical protein [Iodobacter fluviatilis]QBC45500.1 hypothetical protein C1H71_19505 [Iodobacter fluviatilis]
MRNKLFSTLLITSGLLIGQAALAGEIADDEVLVGVSEQSVLEAKVDAIDIDQRTIQLSLPDGQVLKFEHVSPKITHFDQVKVNDKVGIASAKSTALVLQKGGAGIRRMVEAQGKDVTVDGAGILKTRTVYNDILSVNLNAGNISIKNLEGAVITIPVENKALLMKASAGDQLLIVNRAKLIVWAKSV